MKTYLCACNGGPCEGICRETHLVRRDKEPPENICGAAYIEEKVRRSKYREDRDD